MSRIIFLNRFFHPDTSATSQLLTDLAFHLARQGRDVHVVTSALPEQAHAERGTAALEGVTIHRLKAGPIGRSGLYFRASQYGSFHMSAAALLGRMLRRGDILIAKTDPPLLSILASRLGAARGARVVNWLQDLYPEVAIELGVPLLQGALGRLVVALRNGSLRRADINVAISEGMAARLVALGIPPERVRVIHNWADDDQIVPVPPTSNPLRRQWGLEGSFVVGYSGNLGRAHEVKTLLDAAELLGDRGDIVFLFIGGGHHWAKLQSAVHKRRLTSFVFKPFQARKDLALSLSVPDVHWVSLRPELDKLILPSKIYGIAAAGRPCIAVTGDCSELSSFMTLNRIGRSVEIGRAEELAAVIRDMADDSDVRHAMGLIARQALETHYTKATALQRWATLISALN